mmetsp:Transcript_6911/g.21600  ORF Transcript_6911/g.21600 Transcript_6911/m.21600 type:complete len:304 (+) Transcript_6911:1501-2412(+)
MGLDSAGRRRCSGTSQKRTWCTFVPVEPKEETPTNCEWLLASTASVSTCSRRIACWSSSSQRFSSSWRRCTVGPCRPFSMSRQALATLARPFGAPRLPRCAFMGRRGTAWKSRPSGVRRSSRRTPSSTMSANGLPEALTSTASTMLKGSSADLAAFSTTSRSPGPLGAERLVLWPLELRALPVMSARMPTGLYRRSPGILISLCFSVRASESWGSSTKAATPSPLLKPSQESSKTRERPLLEICSEAHCMMSSSGEPMWLAEATQAKGPQRSSRRWSTAMFMAASPEESSVSTTSVGPLQFQW